MAMVAQGRTDARVRRTNDRVLSWWREMRGDRRYPTLDEVVEVRDHLRDDSGSLMDNLFIVYFDGAPQDSVFTAGSGVLDSVCGTETTGRRVDECLPADLRDSMLGFVRTISKTCKPIAVSSRFTTEGGEEVLYRSIYLPLSREDESVDHLIGAFSCKAA